MPSLNKLAAAAALLSAATLASAAQTFCVFDILGAHGEGFNAAKDYAVAMQKNGADIKLKVYIDERVALEDFRTGQCDGVSATALRTRAFAPLAASIDSIGAATVVQNGKIDMKTSFEVVKRTIQTFTSPQAAKLMVNNGYEIAGILPLGPAYPFLNDRKISSVEAAAGKKIAAFDYDKAQAAMIQRIGAQAVSADVTNFATKFNNGAVDIIVAPAMVYKPLELNKGIGTKGAVARMPMIMLSYQMLIRPEKFPEGFGQKSREYWLSQFDRAVEIIERAEKDVPANVWLELPAQDAQRYSLMMREARIDIAKQGLYDQRGLKIIKKIRCSLAPAESECADSAELEWK
jgi:hypothetical protein